MPHEEVGMEPGGRVVVFSGGGTGGHLYPALALADALVERRPDVRPFFVGASRGIEARVLPQRGLPHLLLPVRGFRRGALFANIGGSAALLASLWRTWSAFRRLRPELVVVTGGYAGAPAGIVAGLTGLPLVLQEQNALPGVTTRLLARWARRIHVAFPEVEASLPGRPVVHSGNPIVPPAAVDAHEARARFGLAAGGRVVLVVGGSQGSVALNRAMVDAVRGVETGELARAEGIQLLWATGPGKDADVRVGLGGTPPSWVRVVDYIDDMPGALAVADVAVSRAGAMATSELLAWGVPMILVPFPAAAADHQRRNAVALAEAGAAIHLPESELSGARVWETVAGLASDDRRLADFAAAARRRARPDAAERIASELASLVPEPSSDSSGRAS